jgi:hypothetical protein
MTLKSSAKGRLTKSALITTVLHLAAVAALFSKPLHLNSRFFSQAGRTPLVFLEEENNVILKRNLALEEAFSDFNNPSMFSSSTEKGGLKELISEKSALLGPIALSLPKFIDATVHSLPTPPLAEEVAVVMELPPLSEVRPLLEEPSIAPSHVKDIDETPLPPLPVSFEEPLALEFIPSEEPSSPFSLSYPQTIAPKSVDKMASLIKFPALCEAPDERVLGVHSDFSVSPLTPKSIAGTQIAFSAGEYGLPALELQEWSEFFNVDIKTYPKEEGGFLFSIHLAPKVDLSEYRLKQNYLFVVDNSNSVDKHRYQTAKKAVSRAISALRPGDFFNILILDSSVTKLSESSQPLNKNSVVQAEEFLEKHSKRHYGAATDLYTTLTKILSPGLNSGIQPEEVVTVILISDGDSPLKPAQQRKKINSWIEANHDRITLYAATAGQGNNLSSLKMLSLANRGSLLYSDTHAAFPRKLAKLVMDLRYPIAKQMTASVSSQDPSNRIAILPPSSRLPNLFSDHPYVLIGSCDKLLDFTLLLEGKNKDQVFSIKKTISLSKAKQGSRLLLKQWGTEKAHELLDQYIQEGTATLLQQAEKQLHHDAQNSRR